jgi:hypothetical protein
MGFQQNYVQTLKNRQTIFAFKTEESKFVKEVFYLKFMSTQELTATWRYGICA